MRNGESLIFPRVRQHSRGDTRQRWGVRGLSRQVSPLVNFALRSGRLRDARTTGPGLSLTDHTVQAVVFPEETAGSHKLIIRENVYAKFAVPHLNS